MNTIAPGVIDNGFHAAHTSAENMDRTRLPAAQTMHQSYLHIVLRRQLRARLGLRYEACTSAKTPTYAFDRMRACRTSSTHRSVIVLYIYIYYINIYGPRAGCVARHGGAHTARPVWDEPGGAPARAFQTMHHSYLPTVLRCACARLLESMHD